MLYLLTSLVAAGYPACAFISVLSSPTARASGSKFGLQGIVSEVKAVYRNLVAINTIREANLLLLTNGQLNNVPEVVYMRHLMGVDGVIVDLVQDITEALFDFVKPVEVEEDSLSGGNGQIETSRKGQILIALTYGFSFSMDGFGDEVLLQRAIVQSTCPLWGRKL
ncbi:hypothetical protein NE237_019630 [Protea cynaroides]|uniref:Glycerophosphodiester phosphodiesterase n=1 Tax=Protea cynaroides TaxID=273540 RepID=A0A9Q0K2P5_9MAGN|nr:hypothetical protein NE237_019630 [Protea cynaroides]